MLRFFTRGNNRYKRSSVTCKPPITTPVIAATRSGLQNLISKMCMAALIVFFLLSFVGEVGAVDSRPASSRPQWKQAENQTMVLVRLMAQHRYAGEPDKAFLLDKLVEQAKARQTLLGELAKTDPVGARRAVLPAKIRNGMPDEVQQLLERKQVLEGELEVYYEDYKDGSHKLRNILKTTTGLVELRMAEQAKQMQSGMLVRVRGWLFKHSGDTLGSLVLEDSPDSLELLADGAVTSATTAIPAILANTIGEQRTLVLLVNFQDNSVEPWPLAQVEEMVFGTVNDFYLENSYGRTWLSGDVYGYYTLPIDAVCDTVEIETYTEPAAAANGINVNSYDRLIYVFPQVSGCGWTGKGTVVGSPSRAWINGSLDLRTVGHELGHNFGLQHAKKLECGINTIGGDCYTVEYGDSLDIMGSPGFTGNFNALNKELLGWLNDDPSSTSGQIIIADMDGSYQLEPYETAPGNAPKALKILRGVDSVSGRRLWYYLEYRQPLGFDTYIGSYPAMTQGALFHLGTENDTNSSQWIDMTPASASADWNDAVLPVNNSYSDFDAGVTITTERADATGASVNISYTGPSCIPSNPVLSLSPTESAWVAAGSTVTYTATVTNQDSVGCAASDFIVTADVPVGWAADSASLNLPPGASAKVNLNVTSLPLYSDGFYDILISVQKSNDNDNQITGMVTYVVDTPNPACIAADPLLRMPTGSSAEAQAGTTVYYTGTVTNQSSSGCEASDFRLFADLPAGWSADSKIVKVAPGADAPFKLGITSPAKVLEGDYLIVIRSSNITDPIYADSTTVSYRIVAPLNNAPVAVDDTISVFDKNAVKIDVLSNDSDPDNAPLTIIQVSQGTQGSVQISGDGGLLYTPSKTFKGIDSFSYTVSDGDLSDTAIVSVSLEKSNR